MFKFYFCKNNGKWEETSELEFHAKLYMYVNLTTPVIKYLLEDEKNIYSTWDNKIDHIKFKIKNMNVKKK